MAETFKAFTDTSSKHTIIFSAVILLAVQWFVGKMLFGKERWKAEGKHILVTGGSQGLGLSLAELLASQGGHVTIVARNEGKLQQALEKIKASSASPSQSHHYISADLSTFSGAREALSKHKDLTGAPAPHTVFCCAGGAKPGYFLDQTEEDFELGMKMDYWTALSTSHACARAMRGAQVKGKIVLVSSLVGLCGLIGYSQYAPMKHAIRGLAETLRSELLLYDISVHCYFPAGILSPGFETEEKTKPEPLKTIEQGDAPLKPEVCAKKLVQGVSKGNFFITSDLQSDLFRAACSGVQPGNGWVLDRLKGMIGTIALPIWREWGADQVVRKHRKTMSKAVSAS